MTDSVDPLRALIADIVRVEVAKALAAAQPANDDYLTAAEAGEVAGVSCGTIRKWVREGKLAQHRAGNRVRVRRGDLVALMARGGPVRRRTVALSPEAMAIRDFG